MVVIICYKADKVRNVQQREGIILCTSKVDDLVELMVSQNSRFKYNCKNSGAEV